MRTPLLLSGLVLASHLSAQQPVLHANEVLALHHLRAWLAGPPNVHVPFAAGRRGYEAWVFGFDRAGKPTQGSANRIDPEATCVMLMGPRRDALWPTRLLFGNRAGRIFLGSLPPGAGADWRPTVATFSGPGVDVHLNNMLLQSGTAVDGTTWERVDDHPALVERPFRVRLVSRDDARLPAGQVEIGGSPFPWHPSWVSVDDARVVSFQQAVRDGGAAEVLLEGRGIAADGMRLFVPGLRLSPANVSYAEGEVVVTYGREALADPTWLEDQAWAARALQLFAAAQEVAKNEARFDRDHDGRGEYGEPNDVLPAGLREYRYERDGRYLFRNHRFAVFVPEVADEAEQRFVAYGWPEVAHDDLDLVFCVDQTGIVRAASAARRFAGPAAAPGREALQDASLGWRRLP